MDIKSNLILLKDQDVTEKIATCIFDDASAKWHITYVNYGKLYTVNKENLIWYSNPKQIDPNSTALYVQGKLLADIDSILDYGVHLRIFHSNKRSSLFEKSQISLDDPYPKYPKAQATWAYLTALSSLVSIKENQDRSFLNREYEKITAIHRDSVLSSYLKGDAPKTRQCSSLLIYPFGFNLSQKSAVRKAFSSSVSIIEGPPGTGKT